MTDSAQPVRKDVVFDLMNAASDAVTAEVLKRGDVTANEVFSTYFTLARSAIYAARMIGVPPENIQQTVHSLLLDCVDEGDKKVN